MKSSVKFSLLSALTLCGPAAAEDPLRIHVRQPIQYSYGLSSTPSLVDGQCHSPQIEGHYQGEGTLEFMQCMLTMDCLVDSTDVGVWFSVAALLPDGSLSISQFSNDGRQGDFMFTVYEACLETRGAGTGPWEPGTPLRSHDMYGLCRQGLRAGGDWVQHEVWEVGLTEDGFILSGRDEADMDMDGEVSVPDLFVFITGWFSLSPRSDTNSDGTHEVSDLFSFLSVWFRG